MRINNFYRHKKPKKTWKNYLLPELFHWNTTLLGNFTELFHFLHSYDCCSGVIQGIVASKLLSQSILYSCHFKNNPHSTTSNNSSTRWSRSQHHSRCPIISITSIRKICSFNITSRNQEVAEIQHIIHSEHIIVAKINLSFSHLPQKVSAHPKA